MKFLKKNHRILFGLVLFNIVLTLSCTRVISRIQYNQMFKKADLLPDTIKMSKIEKANDTLNFELRIPIPPKFVPYHGLIQFEPTIYDSDIACKLKTMTWQGQHVKDDAYVIDYKKGAEIWYETNVAFKYCTGKDFKIYATVIEGNGRLGWKYLKVIHVEDFRTYCDSIE